MNTSKYFLQGFLFVFGLCNVPFLEDVNTENKIAHYWSIVSSRIQNIFYAEIAKSPKQ